MILTPYFIYPNVRISLSYILYPTMTFLLPSEQSSSTARDWWEIKRSKVAPWEEFKTAFVSTFLAEDYEDELAERVQTKNQGDNESIRDFAYS